MDNSGWTLSRTILWGVIITLSLCMIYIIIINYNSSETECNRSSSEDFQKKVFNYLTFGNRNYIKVNNTPFCTKSPFLELQEVPMFDDVIALQNVYILDDNWKNPEAGSVEVFGPTENFGRILAMKSFHGRKIKNKYYQQSYGLSISGSIGLNITEHGGIDIKLPSGEYVGAVYLMGNIKRENVMFCCFRGDHYFETIKNNVKILRDIFEKAKGRKTVIVGTFFSTNHGEMEKLQREFSFEMEKGPLWTTHKNSYNTEHILVKNCNMVKEPTIISAGFSSGWLTDVIVDVEKDFITNSNMTYLE